MVAEPGRAHGQALVLARRDGHSRGAAAVDRGHTRSAAARMESIGAMVSAEHIAKVIGKGGAGLRQIRETTGIQVQQNDGSGAPRRVDLSGGSAQVAAAFQMLAAKAFPDSDAHIYIPASAAGQVVGRGGENLRKVRELCNVHLSLVREPETNAATGQQEPPPDHDRRAGAAGHGPALRARRPRRPRQLHGRGHGTHERHARAGRHLVPGARCEHEPRRGPDPRGRARRAGGRHHRQGWRSDQADGGHRRLPRVDVLPGERRKAPRRVPGLVLAVYDRAADAARPDLHGLPGRRPGADRPDRPLHDPQREAAGAVIGKSGASLNEVREKSGARIQLAREDAAGQRPCCISGTLEAVTTAESLIHDIVKSAAPPPGAVPTPGQMPGMVA
ncbi:unnamed protein product [Prorocentrum cordatum]|uniref:K Homology domain-containing protein n=1 Tax=Prorocentrum cordatum TaxID=2364126 RepID=A0ABN9UCL6_9DINO|nr:unnamed protein product [Polarella glacialis]